MNNEEFSRIFEIINGSNTSIPSQALLSILAGIVKTSDKNCEDIKKISELVNNLPTEEIVSKVILFTCNSVLINIWNIFGPELEKCYKAELEKQNKSEEKSEA